MRVIIAGSAKTPIQERTTKDGTILICPTHETSLEVLITKASQRPDLSQLHNITAGASYRFDLE